MGRCMNAVLSINRFSENGPIPERSERFYLNNNEWYFSVRVGLDQGPYETFAEARQALALYIKESLTLA